VNSNPVVENMSRLEHQLQEDFGKFLLEAGEIFENIEFEFSETRGALKPDFWINSKKLVVEAKVSSAREYIRLGIGQVLDYAHLSKMHGSNYSPALLVPNAPSADLIKLISDLGITLILKRDSTFDFIPPN
jgi:hypothetical protein